MVELRRAGALVAALAAVVLLPGSASAHQSDPRTATVVDAVTPALPAGVVIQARTGIAAELVADNPTAQPLDVLGRDGRVFLRISSGGVLADLGSPDFFDTSTPAGAGGARQPGAVRFVRISSGHSWGWYDARLQPSRVVVPSDQRRPARLASFTVPFAYAGRPVRVTGHLEFRPLLGGFSTEVTAVPAGVHAQLLQGRLPAVFLTADRGTSLSVLGEDGQPFLRLGAHGSAVNTASRTYAEDRAARGETPPATGPAPRWQPLPGPSYTWLDARLRAPQEPPRDATRPGVVGQWRIPLSVNGRARALAGLVRWTPDPALAPTSARAGSSGLLAIGGVGVLAVGTVLVRLRRGRGPSGVPARRAPRTPAPGTPSGGSGSPAAR